MAHISISPALQQLIDALCGLPGIGPKTAQRMSFQLLCESGRQKGHVLSSALKNALEHITLCSQCRGYTEQTTCELCQSPKRDRTKLCVVETPADILAIEHTHSFQGLYFVLHGRLSPLDGIGPQEIGIPHLLHHIKEQAIKELIIATNPTMEGRATAHYIVSHLEDTPITCTQLAHGIPLGGELEYLDGGTLAHALQQRTTIE